MTKSQELILAAIVSVMGIDFSEAEIDSALSVIDNAPQSLKDEMTKAERWALFSDFQRMAYAQLSRVEAQKAVALAEKELF